MVQTRNDGRPLHRDLYEWKAGAITEAGAVPTTDITSKTGFTALFDTVDEAYECTIEASAAIYVRLNKNDTDIITITATTPFTAPSNIVRKIFVATGGAAVTVTVKLA